MRTPCLHNLVTDGQCAFAVITPALISGATVGRMKFSSYIVFLVLWTTIVVRPFCLSLFVCLLYPTFSHARAFSLSLSSLLHLSLTPLSHGY